MNRTSSIITVVVYSPNHAEPRHFEWEAELLVGKAAIAAAEAFGIFVGETKPTFRNEAGDILDTAVTLAEAGVHEGSKLELVSSGGGV